MNLIARLKLHLRLTKLTKRPQTLIVLLTISLYYANINIIPSQCNQKQRNNQTKLQFVGSTVLNRVRVGKNLVLSEPPPTTMPPPPPPIPEFEGPIGNQTVAMGRDAQLSCKIRDLGAFRTAWLRVEDKGILTIHNNIITRNYRFGLINNDDGRDFTLTIKNVQPSDRGSYMCQINSVPMKYAIGYLDVLTPPAFDGDPSASDDSATSGESTTNPPTTAIVTLTEGSNATLTCRANGHPTPDITWRREDNQPILLDGAAISGAEGVAKVEGSSLNLGPVHRLNSGAYLCIASNGVQPSASKRQVLDVQFPPVIRIPQLEVGVGLQEPEVTLSCYVELNPAGSYHWAKLPPNSTATSSRQADDQAGSSDDLSLLEHDELSNSDKYDIVIKSAPSSDRVHMALTIRKIERTDFTSYKCIVKNSLGIQSSAIKLVESSSSHRTGIGANNNHMLEDKDFMLDKQQNDQAMRGESTGNGNARQKQSMFSRAHTRSSWIQRGSGSGRHPDSNFADSASSSASSITFESPAYYKISSKLLLALASSLASLMLLLLLSPSFLSSWSSSSPSSLLTSVNSSLVWPTTSTLLLLFSSSLLTKQLKITRKNRSPHGSDYVELT